MLAGLHTLAQHSSAQIWCAPRSAQLENQEPSMELLPHGHYCQPMSSSQPPARSPAPARESSFSFGRSNWLLKQRAGTAYSTGRRTSALHPLCYLNSVKREFENQSGVTVHPLNRPRPGDLNSFTKKQAESQALSLIGLDCQGRQPTEAGRAACELQCLVGWWSVWTSVRHQWARRREALGEI
jgi:hypothetical protein